jgi:outer membrane protein assembly factor BamB/tetratricopeptide (TPR) repeat protein
MNNREINAVDKSRGNLTRRQVLQTTAVAAGILGGVTASSTGVAAQEEVGEEQWSFNTEGTITSSPTIVDSFVYFGSDDGNVYALNESNAFERWAFQTDGSVQSSPTVVSGIVFVGSQDSNLYAINTESGEEEWAFSTGGAVDSSPTVVDGTVFVGSNDGTLYAVDASSGQETWAYETGGAVKSSPVVVNGSVFVGSDDGTLYAINTKSGAEQWTFETDGSIKRSPTVANKMVYASSDDNTLYAVSASSGEERWTFESEFGRLSMPTVASVDPFRRDTVFVGDLTGTVYALNAELGGPRWESDLKDGTGTPTVVQSNVFLGNRNGIYALNADSGSFDWNIDSKTTSAPTVADGTLFFGSGSTLRAINAGSSFSSEGSRTTLGTLGHTNEWAYANQAFEIDTQPPPPDDSDDSPPPPDDGDDSPPPPDDGDGNQPSSGVPFEMIAAGGAGVAVLASIGGAYKWLSSSDTDRQPVDSFEEETSSPDVQDEVIEATETADTTDDVEPDVFRDDADELVVDATAAREEGDLETAITLYDEALDLYKAAIDEIDDEDTCDELKETIAQTNGDLEAISQIQIRRGDLIEALQLGETSFQTAVAAHVNGQHTVARLRYRQARDQYQRALDELSGSDHELLSEAIQVAVNREKNINQRKIATVIKLPEKAVDALEDADIETVADLQDESTASAEDGEIEAAEQVGELQEEGTITTEVAAQLTALYWWHDQETYRFTTEAEISRRYDQSSAGYEATK